MKSTTCIETFAFGTQRSLVQIQSSRSRSGKGLRRRSSFGKIIFLILLVSLFAPKISTAANACTMVWIVAGQSNTYSGLSASLGLDNSDVPWNVEYWCEVYGKQALRQVASFRQIKSFGPEVRFSQLISQQYPDDYHVIIKFCLGGTGMGRWQVGGDLYEGMLCAVSTVVGARPVQYKGLLWIQGETDSLYADAASLYRERLTGMIQGLRAALACDLPVLIALVQWNGPYIFNVNLAECMIGLSVPNVRLIPTNHLPRRLAHFTSRGQLLLGARFFEALTAR